jgi:hypothetical protein
MHPEGVADVGPYLKEYRLAVGRRRGKTHCEKS